MVLLEEARQVPRRDMMRPDALGTHVRGVARFIDEADGIGIGRRIERCVAVALIPMLEARGDEIDLVAVLMQQLGKEGVARRALDLAAELRVDAENGYAASRRHLSPLPAL